MNGLFLVWMKQRYNTHTTPLFLLLTIILYIIQFWTLWNKKHLQLPDNRTLWYIFNIYTEQTATITHTTAERIVLVGARNSQDFSEFSMCNVAELYGWEYLKYVPELSKYNNMDTTNNNNNSVSNQKNTNSSVSLSSSTIQHIVHIGKTLDPLKTMGYLVCDDVGHRMVTTSPQYEALLTIVDRMNECAKVTDTVQSDYVSDVYGEQYHVMRLCMLDVVVYCTEIELSVKFPQLVDLYHDVRSLYMQLNEAIERVLPSILSLDSQKQVNDA